MTFCDKIGFMRFFGRIVIAYAARLFVYGYACAPFILKFYYANKPRFISFIRFSNILRISVFKHLAQIFKSVIMFNAIYVVDIFYRPIFCHVKPRQPMRFVNFAINTYRDVSNAFFFASGHVTNLHATSNSFTPFKQPRLRFIIKHLTKPFCGKFCHFNPPMLNMYNKIILIGGQA